MTDRLSRIIKRMEVLRILICTIITTAGLLTLAGCDGGVSYEGDAAADQESETVEQQEVGGSKSTYGKARDQAENIVEKSDERQQQMLEMMEPEGE